MLKCTFNNKTGIIIEDSIDNKEWYKEELLRIKSMNKLDKLKSEFEVNFTCRIHENFIN